jgi:hypothetical protein
MWFGSRNTYIRSTILLAELFLPNNVIGGVNGSVKVGVSLRAGGTNRNAKI